MEIKNIEKLPADVQKTLLPLAEELIKLYGDDIISIFVYGSATGSDYNRKTSDINVAVVLEKITLAKLKPVLKTVRAGMRKKVTAPLFLTPSYIKMSLDTFPMEFLAMKDSGCVLFGKDVLADIEVNTEDLRRECEYQLKGKLLTIRQAYLEQATSRRGLEALIKASFRALVPVFRNVLRIKRGQRPPEGKEGLLRELGEEFGIDVSSFLEVLRDKKADGRIGARDAETFLNGFLLQLERLAEIVDGM